MVEGDECALTTRSHGRRMVAPKPPDFNPRFLLLRRLGLTRSMDNGSRWRGIHIRDLDGHRRFLPRTFRNRGRDRIGNFRHLSGRADTIPTPVGSSASATSSGVPVGKLVAGLMASTMLYPLPNTKTLDVRQMIPSSSTMVRILNRYFHRNRC